MKAIKIIGLFVFSVAIAMLVLTFYSLIEDEEALVVLASYVILIFFSVCIMAVGIAMIFYKNKESEQ